MRFRNTFIPFRFLAACLVLIHALAASPLERSPRQIGNGLGERSCNDLPNKCDLRHSPAFHLTNLSQTGNARDTRPTQSPQDEAKAAKNTEFAISARSL